ncbi:MULTISPECIES: ankyrin repeat domain-containing protein [Candidatus Cardinium]|uniref:ankyrin repeat domain-containing protein n=1 Tax=Candidatus Cardinium TaxID=273135 RepID=UPI001FA9CBA8|nr:MULTISPECIES: ankyrin repeat domain-containing protein [Cardinium]
MKTKKTYTRYRVGLFIGLFSLHTLSSCVNTGRALGMGCFESKGTKQKVKAFYRDIEQKQAGKPLHDQSTSEDLTFNFATAPWYTSKRFIGSLVVLVVVGVGTIGATAYLLGTNPVVIQNDNFIGNLTTAIENTTVTTPENVSNSITSTTASVCSGLLHIANMTGLSLLWNRNSSNNNCANPSGFRQVTSITPVPKHLEELLTKWQAANCVKDPMVLDEEIRRDLMEHNDDKARLKYWVTEKGLSINARDQVGTPLLMRLMYSRGDGDQSDLQFAIDQNLDLNMQDCNGDTVLHKEILPCHDDKVIFLLNNGANPVIENKRKHTPLSYVKKFCDEFIIEKVTEAAEKWVSAHPKQKREISYPFIAPTSAAYKKNFKQTQKKFGTRPYKKSRQRKK